MDNETYEEVQAQLSVFAMIVKDLPLQEFINAGNRAMEIGPIMDPSLWIKGNRRLASVLALAKALRTFQAEVERQLEGAHEL